MGVDTKTVVLASMVIEWRHSRCSYGSRSAISSSAAQSKCVTLLPIVTRQVPALWPSVTEYMVIYYTDSELQCMQLRYHCSRSYQHRFISKIAQEVDVVLIELALEEKKGENAIFGLQLLSM